MSRFQDIYCFRCQQNQLGVKQIGDLCDVCSIETHLEGEPKGRSVKHMSLSSLIHTQYTGWVPENEKYWESELPVEDIDWFH